METKIKSKYLQEFIKEITYKNRNPKDVKALSLLEDISTNPERVITSGEKLFRCRIIKKGASINQKENFYGFDDKGSFVPPSSKTRDMRANYRYIPYLYCTNDPYIALVEVRPRLGANISIATIEAKEKLTLLDFTNGKKPPKMTDAKANLFSDLSSMFSKPVTDDDDITDYIPTQFIAEYAKRLGYDGIVFRSSLVPDINENQMERFNIVVFNYQKCEPIKSNVIEITNQYYDCQQTDNDSKKISIHSFIDEELNKIISGSEII
jgi:hypothetical protein